MKLKLQYADELVPDKWSHLQFMQKNQLSFAYSTLVHFSDSKNVTRTFRCTEWAWGCANVNQQEPLRLYKASG